MQKIISLETLRSEIVTLEQRQIAEEKLFKDQFFATYESLKPVNVLRNAINELLTFSDLKEPLIETTAGLLSGYLSRILIIRNSKNPFLRLAGIFVQYGVTNIVSKNSTYMLTFGKHFIKSLFSRSSRGNAN